MYSGPSPTPACCFSVQVGPNSPRDVGSSRSLGASLICPSLSQNIPPLTRPVPFISLRSCFIFESSIPQTLWAYLSSAIWTPYLIVKPAQIMTTFFPPLIDGLWGPFFMCYRALPFDLAYLSFASAAAEHQSSLQRCQGAHDIWGESLLVPQN